MNCEAVEKEYGDVSEGVKEFCNDALTVQDACNLSGVVQAFATAMRCVWDDARRLGKGTEWVNCHPIAVLFVDKLQDMVSRRSLIDFRDAADFCERHRS
jgi:hypothetical protein